MLKAWMLETVWLPKAEYVLEKAPLEEKTAPLEEAQPENGSLWELGACDPRF